MCTPGSSPCRPRRRATAWCLYAPNAFVVDTVRERYLARIRELLGHFAGLPTHGRAGDRLARARRGRAAGRPPSLARARRRSSFHGNLDTHYTFDNFVEGRSNQLGRAAALQVAQNPATAPTTRCCCTAAPAWARPT